MGSKGAVGGPTEWALAAAAPTLSARQVWELREHLGRVRGFWAGLPLTMCRDPTVAAEIVQEAAPCWTGTGRGK